MERKKQIPDIVMVPSLPAKQAFMNSIRSIVQYTELTLKDST
jgi:hypothetical protein